MNSELEQSLTLLLQFVKEIRKDGTATQRDKTTELCKKLQNIENRDLYYLLQELGLDEI